MLKEYRTDFGPNLVCLLETRVSSVRAYDVITKFGFSNSFRVEANGFAGGIWFVWNDNISDEVLEVYFQMVHVKISSNQNRDSFLCSIVYSSP